VVCVGAGEAVGATGICEDRVTDVTAAVSVADGRSVGAAAVESMEMFI